MSFNKGGFNLSPFNVVIESGISYTSLTLLKCANWAEGPMHGGIATETSVDILWDYISEYENVNGMSDYRKCFIKNYGELSTGECNIRCSFITPNAISGRINAVVAIGTTSDSMANKPPDSSFGAALTTTISPGESIPIWIKRTISAGGTGSYLGIQVIMSVSED